MAVSYQFVIDKRRVDAELAEHGRVAGACPYFGSYQRDLLSHALIDAPPLGACHVDARGDHCAIHVEFGPEVGFTIENRRVTLRRPARRVAAQALLSRCDFPASAMVVLGLTLRFELPGAPLDEYDVVQLCKPWAGGGDLEKEITGLPVFHLPERAGSASQPCGTVGALAAALFGPLVDSQARPAGGCIQMVALALRTAAAENFVGRLGTAVACLQQGREFDPSLQPAMLALGGILQNILDLDEVDQAELSDMLHGAEASSANGIKAIHRGTLLCVSGPDRVYDQEAQTIGISPYLLLPQAVLLQNAQVMQRAGAAVGYADRYAALLDSGRPGADGRCQPDPGKPPLDAQRDAAHRAIVAAIDAGLSEDMLPRPPRRLIRALVRALWRDPDRPAPAAEPRFRCGLRRQIDECLTQALREEAIDRLSTALDREWLDEVFQYPAERWIIEHGSHKRGLIAQREQLRRRLAQFDQQVAEAERRRSERFQVNLGVWGVIIAVLQINPAGMVYAMWGPAQEAGKALEAGLTLGFDIAFALWLGGERLVWFTTERSVLEAARALARDPDCLAGLLPGAPLSPA